MACLDLQVMYGTCEHSLPSVYSTCVILPWQKQGITSH